jgi:hypothetical protein
MLVAGDSDPNLYLCFPSGIFLGRSGVAMLENFDRALTSRRSALSP